MTANAFSLAFITLSYLSFCKSKEYVELVVMLVGVVADYTNSKVTLKMMSIQLIQTIFMLLQDILNQNNMLDASAVNGFLKSIIAGHTEKTSGDLMFDRKQLCLS
jgi:hypothetical protein